MKNIIKGQEPAKLTEYRQQEGAHYEDMPGDVKEILRENRCNSSD